MKDNVAQKEVTIQEVSSTLRVYHVVNFLVIKRFVGCTFSIMINHFGENIYSLNLYVC